MQKILCPYLKPVFPKCGNASNTQKSYSLRLRWPLGLLNTSLDAKFRVQNFSCLLINQCLKVPGSTVSLNCGKCPNYNKRCIIQLTFSLYAWVVPYLMQHFDLKTLGYLICTTIHDLRDYIRYSQLFQCTKYINNLTLTALIVLTLEKHPVRYKP